MTFGDVATTSRRHQYHKLGYLEFLVTEEASLDRAVKMGSAFHLAVIFLFSCGVAWALRGMEYLNASWLYLINEVKFFT